MWGKEGQDHKPDTKILRGTQIARLVYGNQKKEMLEGRIMMRKKHAVIPRRKHAHQARASIRHAAVSIRNEKAEKGEKGERT